MKKILTLCFLLFFASPAWSLTFYVAKTGSDSNNCTTAQTIGTPKLTINSALACLVAGRGDTLYIRTGTYVEQIMNPASGIATARTTIAAYNATPATPATREVVTLRSGSSAQVLRLNYVGTIHQYITYDGLILDGNHVTQFVVDFNGQDWASSNINHIRMLNCEVKNATMSGVLTGRGTNFLEWIGGSYHDNGTTVGQDHGIYHEGNDALVSGAEFYNNAGFGIHFFNGYAGQSDNRNVATKNYVHNNGSGIVMGPGTANVANNNIVINNTREYGIGAYNGCVNCKIISNTIYGQVGEGIQARPGSSSTTISNNIVFGSTVSNINTYSTTGNTIQTNLCSSAGAQCAIVQASAAALFVNAGGADFGLIATSPAINTGTAISGFVSNDAPDIGAHETITFANAVMKDTAGDDQIEVTILNNQNPPGYPVTNCTGLSLLKNTFTDPIASCTKGADNVYLLTTTGGHLNTDVVTVAYAPGNILDGSLIGGTKSQRLNAFTSQTVTNQIGAGGGGTPVLTQNVYGFESLGGTQAVPDFPVGANREVVLPPNTCIFLQAQIACTVADCGSVGLSVFAQKGGSGGFVAVGNGPTPANSISTIIGTGRLPPERLAGPTTQRLGGSSGNFIPGGVQLDASQVPAVTLPTGKFTEAAVALCVGSSNTFGQFFELQWANGGVLIPNAPGFTPKITIGPWTARSGSP